MKEYERIEKGDVWARLENSEDVYAVVLKPVIYDFKQRMYRITNATTGFIRCLLKEENVEFYVIYGGNDK